MMLKNNKWPDMAITILLCIMIFILPFSKSMVEISFILAFILWIVKKILSYEAHTKFSNLLRPVKTELNIPIYIFITACFLSVLSSVSIFLSLKSFFSKLLEGMFIYFILTEIVNKKSTLNLILVSILLSIGLTIVNGLVQYITGADFIRHYIMTGGRIQSSFDNSNKMAGWLVMLIPLVFSLAFYRSGIQSHRIVKIALLVLSSIMVLSLILTYSRGAWIGFIGSVFFMMFLKKRKPIIILVGVLLLLVFVVPSPIRERIETLAPDAIAGMDRVYLWREALTIIKDFPVLGCGLNTYAIVAPHYKSFKYGGIYAHNSYLQMTAEIGILGLMAFAFILFVLFKISLQEIERMSDKFYRSVLVGLLSGLFGFLIHSIFDVNIFTLQLSVLMWFIIGLLIASQKIALNNS